MKYPTPAIRSMVTGGIARFKSGLFGFVTGTGAFSFAKKIIINI